jgi:hypothetical protein
MKAFLDPSWPSVDVLDIIIRKSFGQFIYAPNCGEMSHLSAINPQTARTSSCAMLCIYITHGWRVKWQNNINSIARNPNVFEK